MKNNKVKFSPKDYWKPTPKNLRILGDTVLLASGIGAILIPGAKWVIIAGLVGKYLTNCATKLDK